MPVISHDRDSTPIAAVTWAVRSAYMYARICIGILYYIIGVHKDVYDKLLFKDNLHFRFY